MIKKITNAALSIVCALTMSAQDAAAQTSNKDSLPVNASRAGHYLTFDLGGGLHNIAFKTDGYGDKNPGFGFGVGAGYRYFFNPNWGVGIGVNFNTFAAKAKLNFNQEEQNGTDPALMGEHKERNYLTAFNDLEEKVSLSAIDIPIGAYYQHSLGAKWRIGAGAHLIVTTIAGSKYKNNKGDISVDAILPYYNAQLHDLPEHGLTKFSDFSGTPDFKKISIGFGAECKAYYAINKQLDLSMGISGAYRFSDIKNQNLPKLYNEDAREYVGITQSNICDGVKLANLSATIGIRYRLVRKPKPVPAPDYINVDLGDANIPYSEEELAIVEVPEEEPKNEGYAIDIMPEDYAFANNALDMSKQLKRKKVGDPIGAPILFETNSDRLKSDVNTIMDTVVVFMLENPDVTKLEVSAHTDNVGSDAYNLQLSKRRAATVVNYLVSHGVERKRLVPVGYGESRPLNKNATPQQREVNRRVEFMILELAE